MTDDELKKEVRNLIDRVEDLENEREALSRLPEAVYQLKGALDTLQTLVMTRFDKVDNGVQQATGMKTAIQFAAVVVVPVLVALIGGYFVLRAGVSGGK